ncbi:heavy metal translocating P-type ATPase metal-binding domain-containing protein [Gemmatimonadota bacterium]
MSPPTSPKSGKAVSRCPHCGTPVEGTEDAYCCSGCEMAASIIRGAGLEAYYHEREAFPPRPEGAGGDWGSVPVQTCEDGTAEVRLMVDGLRCASCVWVTENVLQRTEGVEEAMISYATGRARLRWDPQKTKLPELARLISALGYRPRILGEEGEPDRDLLVKLGVSAFAAVNIMMLSAALYTGWLGGMDPRYVSLFQWISLALAAPVALWCAGPFFTGALNGLRHGVLHMDLPIALGVAVLFGHGVVVTVSGGDTYLDSMGMLVTLLLAGRVLESHGRRRASEAAVALAASAPTSARRRVGEGLETVAADDLRPGDLVDVGAGEELAADGLVESGSGSVRVALLTGESEPVGVHPGSRVVAGSVLVEGAFTVRVTAVGRETVLEQMADQLRLSADRGVRPSFTDRIAPWFTGATLATAGLTFLAWLSLGGGLEKALLTAVAVLVVACPCALALSRPLAAAAGLGASARRGLLFRSGDALLALESIDLVALDKTGTVTAGDLQVVEATDEVLRVASGLERFSAHPIARAITREAVERGIPLPLAEGVQEEAGFGISGCVDGRRWEIRSGGPGQVLVLADGGDRATIRLGDRVRGDSRRAVDALRAQGLRVVLVTGDLEEVAERIAEDVGIGEFLARLDPPGKADWVRARRDEGFRVLFAGDGLNDGPGLAQADVGIAMGTGAASSILVADGVVSVPSLQPLVSGFRAGAAAQRSIRLNQVRSVGYNVVAVLVAAVGLVNPLVAAILMPLSSGMVIWGASRVEKALRVEEDPRREADVSMELAPNVKAAERKVV